MIKQATSQQAVGTHSPLPQFWDYKCVSPCPALNTMLGTGLSFPCLFTKNLANWALSPAHDIKSFGAIKNQFELKMILHNVT